MKTEQTVQLTRNEKSYRTKKLTIMAIMTAVAYLVTFFIHIPMFEFLTLDFKDAILAFTSLIFGPLSGLIMTVICALVELCTISSTGWIGLIMNMLSSASFVCVAAFIHKKKPCIKSAVFGLTVSIIAMTAVMILWNYLITPIYMGISREVVVEMLIPVFMPFNLLKGALNTSIVIMLYPLISILEKSGLIPQNTDKEKTHKRLNIGIMIFSGIVLITCVCFVILLND